MSDALRQMIREMLQAEIRAAMGETEETTQARTTATRTVSEPQAEAEPERKRRTRRTRRAAPTVGYHARLTKKDKLPDALTASNVRTVLADVIRHPGSTNRDITERTGLVKKAVESALYALRTTDKNGKLLGPGNHKTALVYSAALAE